MSDGHRDTLGVWSRFVAREGHLLRHRPHLLVQQAVNGGPGSPPSAAAELRCRTSPSPWIEWRNRPTSPPAPRLSVGSGFWSLTACAVSGDGRRIVAGSDDGSLREWDADTGRECLVLRAYTDTVLRCWYSQREGRIISVGRNRESEGPGYQVRVRDRESEHDLTVAGVRAYAVLSTDEEDLVLGKGADSPLRVWNLVPFTHVRTLTTAGDDSVAGDLAPCGGLIAAVGQRVQVWDRNAWQLVAAHLHPFVELRHGEPTVTVSACRFSPDATVIALAGGIDGDAAVLVLDARSGRVESRVDVPGLRIQSVAFDRSGRMLAMALSDGTLSVRDLPSGTERHRVRGHAAAVLDCAFAAAGPELVSASADGWLRVWRLDEMDARAGRTSGALACAPAPDGRSLAVIAATKPPGLAVLTQEAASASTFEDVRSEARRGVAFFPDGASLVTGSMTCDALVVDRDTCAIERQLGGLLTAPVRACAVSPDGRWILAGSSWPDPLLMWDAASGEAVRALSGVRGGVNACVFSPDGSLAAACWEHGPPSLQVWALTGRHEAPRAGDCLGEASACAFSPDGLLLAACSPDEIAVWDVRSGTSVRSWTGGRQHGSRLAFSADGTLLVLAEGTTLRVLAIEDGGERAYFQCVSYVHALALGCASDLWVGTTDRLLRLRLHNLDTGDAVTTAARFYDRARRAWSGRPAARCRRCGALFDVPAGVIAAILGIGAAAAPDVEHPVALDLPSEAWHDSALHSSCPACRRPLVFNPFLCQTQWAEA